MSLNDFYLLQIQKKKKGYMNLYKETLIEVLGKEVSWSEVKELDHGLQAKIMIKLENKILLEQSPIDVNRLSRAIQGSRSGAGGCAITNYTCNFCGKEESWGNTATPKICSKCAKEIAENIAKHMYNDILKDGFTYYLP